MLLHAPQQVVRKKAVGWSEDVKDVNREDGRRKGKRKKKSKDRKKGKSDKAAKAGGHVSPQQLARPI